MHLPRHCTDFMLFIVVQSFGVGFVLVFFTLADQLASSCRSELTPTHDSLVFVHSGHVVSNLQLFVEMET